MMLIRQLLKMKNGCEPKIIETPNFSRYCKSTKKNGNVTMTFPVNLSHGCFRTAALLVVTLNMESRKLTGRMYTENRFKNAKAVVVKGLIILILRRFPTEWKATFPSFMKYLVF